MKVTLTEQQYLILLNLYHNYNDAFITLNGNIQDAFYSRVMDRKGFVPTPTPPRRLT